MNGKFNSIFVGVFAVIGLLFTVGECGTVVAHTYFHKPVPPLHVTAWFSDPQKPFTLIEHLTVNTPNATLNIPPENNAPAVVVHPLHDGSGAAEEVSRK